MGVLSDRNYIDEDVLPACMSCRCVTTEDKSKLLGAVITAQKNRSNAVFRTARTVLVPFSVPGMKNDNFSPTRACARY